MKSILAFGDSLTWGAVALKSLRHPHEVRWPNALAAGLKNVRVIEEGMNGRTTVFDDPTADENRNGAAVLPALLKSHAFDASMGMERLIGIVKRFPFNTNYPAPKLLIMSPPALCKTSDEWFNDLWGHAIEESKLFATHYKRVADEQGVHFFDAGSVAKTDPADGGHLDAENTRKLGEALVPVVGKILGI
jgi:lysophospholipase L1-like esterase